MLFMLDAHSISLDMQRKHLNAGSMCVVSLEEVVIFAELCVFLGFLQFSNRICKINCSQTYQSIEADLELLQVYFSGHLVACIGRYGLFKVFNSPLLN